MSATVAPTPTPAQTLATHLKACWSGSLPAQMAGRQALASALSSATLLAEAQAQLETLTDDLCKRDYLSQRLRQTLLAVLPAGSTNV